MNLTNLKPADGSTKGGKKRLGRGQGSGRGGTATRGHKGQKSRSGYSKKIGFEGGQMPLQRRVPKFGFKNPNRVEYKGINLDTLQALIDNTKVKEITPEILVENGLLGKNDLVKVLGRGELTAKINITAHGFSASAKEAIEKQGGTATVDNRGYEPKEEKAPEKKKKRAPKPEAAVEAAEATEEAPEAAAEDTTEAPAPEAQVEETPEAEAPAAEEGGEEEASAEGEEEKDEPAE